MSCIDLLNILSKPWTNVHDIMKIATFGRDNAIKMRDMIIEEIHKSGKEIPIQALKKSYQSCLGFEGD